MKGSPGNKFNARRKLLFFITAFVFLSVSLLSAAAVLAENKEKLELDNACCQTPKDKSGDAIFGSFQIMKDCYFKDHRYLAFINCINIIIDKKKTLEPFVDYFTAITRYSQLKYLEENQIWDEYFEKGNAYREEIISRLDKAVKVTNAKDKVNIYSFLLLWQFHKDHEDAVVEEALSNLIKAVSEYAEDAKSLEPVKDVADKLLSYQERAHAKEIYKIYIGRMSSQETKISDLETMITQFYNEGNLELAQTVADLYLERVAGLDSKEKAVSSLMNIARLFAFKDEGLKDAFYAEKVFKKIEELAGRETFDEELTYLRSFNAEKSKEYGIAKSYYLDLLTRFPQSAHFDEAAYKTGIISAYVLKDVKTARENFEKLAAKETLSPQVISSFYHLGLLSQWEQDLTKAKQYYDKLIERAKDGFRETVSMTKDRLKEIKEDEPLDYNTRLFIDMALKDEYSIFTMSKLDLKSDLYKPGKEKQINLSSTAYPPQSGCIQVTVEYLWSADLGKTVPTNQDDSFSTSYSDSGTKVIWLIATTPSGIIDRNLDFIDVSSGS